MKKLALIIIISKVLPSLKPLLQFHIWTIALKSKHNYVSNGIEYCSIYISNVILQLWAILEMSRCVVS